MRRGFILLFPCTYNLYRTYAPRILNNVSISHDRSTISLCRKTHAQSNQRRKIEIIIIIKRDKGICAIVNNTHSRITQPPNECKAAKHRRKKPNTKIDCYYYLLCYIFCVPIFVVCKKKISRTVCMESRYVCDKRVNKPYI